MAWTPRRRVLLVGVAALLVGYQAPALSGWLLGWQWRVRNLCDLPGVGAACDQLNAASALLPAAALLVVVLVSLAALRWAAIWCLRPVRQLARPVSHVGPQNLGYRIRADGTDELAELSRALDEMMDRIAAGYEGQRRFAANASHELRTPLAVQRTLIEVGMAQPLTNEQVELLTAQLLQTNERNERLIEGLLALSESDQGLRSRTPQRLDEIAAAVVAGYADRARDADVSISTRLRPRVVPGERVLLERLVTNLVENAIKYNRPGGTIEVTVGGAPALTVVNTGPAVPAEAVAGLFEPFRRLSADRTAHGGGAGLGLTIARSIAQAHDGVISAEPAGPGGLRVDVRLPGQL
ncbi:HAMP domain-containing sensor histidine kinase [Plantactinospora sp. CA-290183]|uniref:HAMP domain-containing sensor histidine kinase n=1 Tax=Plantactinospora sp. CA-290183 TaxID=3240006 RepID=UPI003D8C4F22